MNEDVTSFFHGIQSLFAAKYHGRYLATILVEVGRQRPDCLMDFFAHAAGIAKRKFTSPRFELEYVFRGSAGPRRADIAVFANNDDREPIMLVEIKYYDKPIAARGEKPAQLEDYVAWVNYRKDRHFVAICREQLTVDFKGSSYTAVRWGDLAHRLKLHVEKSDLVRLLVDYLEKEGITVQKIEAKPLINFFKNLLCPTWGSGVLANNTSGPIEFGKLQMNLKYMAGAFDPVFKKAWREAGQKIQGDEYAKTSRTATIGFYLSQFVKTTSDTKLFHENEKCLNDSQKDGGTIKVYAQYSLGHGQSDSLRVVFGFVFIIESENSVTNDPVTYAFAEVRGSKLHKSSEDEPYKEKEIKFSEITTTADMPKSHGNIEKVLAKLLVGALQTLLDQKLPLLRQQNAAIKNLLKSLPNVQ